MPVQLKRWIDAIARAGVTFRDTAHDSKLLSLKNVPGFLGPTDVHFINAEGLAIGPEAASPRFARAEAERAAVLA